MEIKFIDIDLEELKRSINLVPKDSFYFSYKPFVNFFANKDVIKNDDFLVAANMIYGWMPTMLHNKKYFKNTENDFEDDLDHAVRVLNRAKSKSELSPIDLEDITKIMNNSIVGASKLLHMANPNSYPIWDSWIYNYMKPQFIGKNKSNYHQDTLLYMEYQKTLLSLINTSLFQELHEQMLRKIQYDISALRALELAMFTASRK